LLLFQKEALSCLLRVNLNTAWYNFGLSNLRLWHFVLVPRGIDECLELERASQDDTKARIAAININKLVSYVVFHNFICDGIGTPALSIATHSNVIFHLTTQATRLIYTVLGKSYGDSYLAHLLKNLTKCNDVVTGVGAFSPDLGAIATRGVYLTSRRTT
jgi:hypothetical protein